MSYDVSFKVKVQGVDKWLEVGECCGNITYNLHDMIVQSTGLEWKNEQDNGLCIDVIPRIQVGYNNLMNHPEQYEKYESPNGWGTISGCRRFFGDLLRWWIDFEEDYPELVNVAHFWIE